MRRLQGFTLIELMVTITVLGILIALAAPSFSKMLQDNRMITIASELQSSLQLARAEAIKRKADVQLCKSNSDASDCSASGTDWQGGWLIRSADGVIKVWDKAQGTTTLSGPSSGITFRGSGLTSTTSQSTWTAAYSGCTQNRSITVSTTGRATLAKGNCT